MARTRGGAKALAALQDPALPPTLQLPRPAHALQTEYDWDGWLGDGTPVEVDVGCGFGRFILARAAANPRTRYLGIEREMSRIAKIDLAARRMGLRNLRILCADALQVVTHFIPPRSVSALYVFFPDPWPKRRHWKRRLFSPLLIEAAERILCKNGTINAASDQIDYIEGFERELEANPLFRRGETFRRDPPEQTDFEIIFRTQGLPIGEATFVLDAPSPPPEIPENALDNTPGNQPPAPRKRAFRGHLVEPPAERAILAQAILGFRDPAEAADSLDELERLSETAGAEVVGRVTQRRPRPAAATLIGSGKIKELRSAIKATGANSVFFDNDLSPMQVNNLDRALETKVIDRTELILQIFARRAQSAEARIQVELAQLRYLLTRLPTSERQARFTGGIGMKGPGEKPLQLRNAPMRKRIGQLKRRLLKIRERRENARTRDTMPRVALVGYTNVGKSSLINRLAQVEDAFVDDQLFATLDTRTRRIRLQEERFALLSDTVGFIRNIPHDLVASFRSTLEVAREADYLLVVADASAPMLEDHIDVTMETLKLIDAGDVPRLLILNKCDRPDSSDALLHATAAFPDAIPVSARTGLGIDTLRNILNEELQKCFPLWQLPSAISRT